MCNACQYYALNGRKTLFIRCSSLKLSFLIKLYFFPFLFMIKVTTAIYYALAICICVLPCPAKISILMYFSKAPRTM